MLLGVEDISRLISSLVKTDIFSIHSSLENKMLYSLAWL